MPACEQCAALIGEPPSLPPHAGLKQLSGRKLSNAWQEYYACAVCGSTLKRVVPFPGFENKAGEPWAEGRKGDTGKLSDDRRHTVNGSYTTKRDRGLIYIYEATWIITGPRVIWDSEVRKGGDWKGNPGGHFPFSPGLDLPLTVKRLVGVAIENLVDVEK